MYTGDEADPGNFGLWDQRLAIQWVNDYIGDFGGDNKRITIAGESAGAMSVMQHAITPLNNGLFQRVIAQSGSASIPLIDFARDGLKDTFLIAETLMCETDRMDDMMQCLREKSVDEYMTVLRNIGDNLQSSPIIDNDLIKIDPRYMTKMSENRRLDEVEFFRSLDVMSGFNAYEGLIFWNFMTDPTQLEDIKPTREEMRNQYLPGIMNVVFRQGYPDEIMKLVEAQYTNWTNPDDFHSIRIQITKLLGDAGFCVPQIEMSRLHKMSSASRNFMYHFAPKPSNQLLPTPSWIPGSNHADEIQFILGQANVAVAWETDLMIKMISYWTNFIKSGDPNRPEAVTPTWPEYNMETGDYILLDKVMSDESAKQHFYAEEVNFWMEVFPDLVDAVQGKGTCGGGTATSAGDKAAVYKTLSVAAALLSFVLLY